MKIMFMTSIAATPTVPAPSELAGPRGWRGAGFGAIFDVGVRANVGLRYWFWFLLLFFFIFVSRWRRGCSGRGQSPRHPFVMVF